MANGKNGGAGMVLTVYALITGKNYSINEKKIAAIKMRKHALSHIG